MLEDVYNSSLKFLFPLNLKSTFEIVGTEAMKLVGAKYSSVFMMVDGQLKRMFASSPILYDIKTRKKGVTYRAYKSERVVLLKNEELKKIHPEFKKIKVGEDVSIPLTYNKITLGVLSIISEEGRAFSKDDIDKLKLFSPLAMMALRKALLYNELHRALRERDLFISIASHELKTPLTSIFAYSQLLAKKIRKGELPRNEDVNKLLVEEARLNKLVSDFLEVNKIKTGRIQFEMEKVDLVEVAAGAKASFENVDKSHKVVIARKVKELWVWGDQYKMVQAVLNILNNASKYSQKNSLIKISFVEDESCYGIRIKDEGVGISETDLPFVFDRFYRAENMKESGMGIGLYLVKYIILKHGGKIDIKSRVGKGTTVSILLPKLNEQRT